MPNKKKEEKKEPIEIRDERGLFHFLDGSRYDGQYIKRSGPMSANAATLAGVLGPFVAAPPAPTTAGPASAEPGKKQSKKDQSGAVEESTDVVTVRRHGQGTYIDRNGAKFSGSWVDDDMQGYGMMRFQSGAVYAGGFDANMFSGHGTYTWANGSQYVGQWRANKMHGEGMLVDTEGIRWRGRFYDGQAVGLVQEL